MTALTRILSYLVEQGVAFVVVGGVAASAHGSARATFDVDICYARDPANLETLARALAPLHPRLRGAPEGLPFLWDAETLRRGLNFTLTTDIGNLDLLGEVSGVGSYKEAKTDALLAEAFGVKCLVISLPNLIAAKRAAARGKDLEILHELEALLEAQQD
jgi:predicted nucleotidyltransferase